MSLLEIHGLGITFGGLRAVHDVAFSVEPGEIVSVIGPNGAGKTTLFNMISGIYRPGAGRVVLDRDDVTGMAPFRLARRGMSRTFQNLQIFQNMTVLENAIAGFHLQEQGALLSDLFNLRASRARARRAEEG
ncbi:ATP-binding cassette domain-containing protein, partial [Bordetella pertussis]